MHAKISKIADNDNNTFAPSMSFCNPVDDCFDASVFSSAASLPQKNILTQNYPISYNAPQKNGAQYVSSNMYFILGNSI